MEIDFIKLSPTQNMTILTETPVPRDRQSAVADALMDYAGVYAEQVGFLEPASSPSARVRLQMMGGEFCGNASMACAAYLANRDQLPVNTDTVITLEVSGALEPIDCVIRNLGNTYRGTVSMPVPTDIREVSFSCGITCPVVFFPGIAHAILPEADQNDMELISTMCSELNCDAFGILRIDSASHAMHPLVYVRSTNSAVYERGCGSGSAALIAYTAFSLACSSEMDIIQPGGVIHAGAVYANGRVSEIHISGIVKLCAVGKAFIDVEI